MKHLKLFESDWHGADKIVKEFSFNNFNEALEEIGKRLPKSITEYKYI